MDSICDVIKGTGEMLSCCGSWNINILHYSIISSHTPIFRINKPIASVNRLAPNEVRFIRIDVGDSINPSCNWIPDPKNTRGLMADQEALSIALVKLLTLLVYDMNPGNTSCDAYVTKFWLLATPSFLRSLVIKPCSR